MKNQFDHYRKTILSGKKKKRTSANSRYATTAFYKSLRPYPRFARTSHIGDVVRNKFFILVVTLRFVH